MENITSSASTNTSSDNSPLSRSQSNNARLSDKALNANTPPRRGDVYNPSNQRSMMDQGKALDYSKSKQISTADIKDKLQDLSISKEKKQPKSTLKDPNRKIVLKSGVAICRARECGHLIHPSYQELFDWNRCPTCEAASQIEQLANRQVKIAELVLETERKRPDLQPDMIFKIVFHEYAENRKLHESKKPTRWSFQKAKMMNLMATCESLQKSEQEWDEFMETDLPEAIHRASTALGMLQEAKKKGAFDAVEDRCAVLNHMSALDFRVSLKGNTTDENKAKKDVMSVKQTNTPQFSKRARRGDETVKWNPTVYVRTDANIDVLRGSSTMRSKPHIWHEAPRSVLRTNTKVPPVYKRSYAPLAPCLTHSLACLNDEIKPRAEGKFQSSRSTFWPGRWDHDGDIVRVDTSCQFGYQWRSRAEKKDSFDQSYNKALGYWESLQTEAEMWDTLED